MFKRFGKFEIKRAMNEQFFFVLKAANGEVIATSELYKTKQSAQKGINAVKKTLLASVEDKTGKFSKYVKIKTL